MTKARSLRLPATMIAVSRPLSLAACVVLATSAGVLAAPTGTSGPIEVPGARYEGGPDAAKRAAAARLKRSDTAAPIYLQIELEPLPAGEPFKKRTATKPLFGAPLQVGVHRELPEGLAATMDATSFDWEAADGGQVATFAVRSPGAVAVRLAIEFQRLPAGSEVRFYSLEAPERALGPYNAEFLSATPRGRNLKQSGSDPFWSPVIDGEVLAVEIFVPGRLEHGEVLLTLRRLSHLLQHPLEERDLGQIGNSGACEKDIACFKKFRKVADSVAKIIFETNEGTFLCTGQLINDTDPDTFKPFFTTAAHCIDKKRVAKTAVFFWFFQRAECNGADPTSVTQTAGGAKLLVTTGPAGEGKLSYDFTLMKLKRTPPPGVTLGGWRVRDPIKDLLKKVKGIHHPGGDVKMGSGGTIIDLLQIAPNGDILFEGPFTHYVVQWKKGVTEPGSSGSAIWGGRRWPKQYELGPLTGGFSSCAAKRDPDLYGIFSEAYYHKAKIGRLLNPDSAAVE